MRMKRVEKYISWKDVWSILKEVEYEDADPDLALVKLVQLLCQAHGSYSICNHKLIFIEYYDYMDYRWSSSIIGSEDPEMRIEQKEELIKKIYEEQECVKRLIKDLNERFYNRDEIYLKVFFEKYFLNNTVSKIKKKFNIHNDRYYVIMKNAQYLAKRSWLLLKPPKAIMNLVLYGTIDGVESFKNDEK